MLRAEQVCKEFRTDHTAVAALRGVSLRIEKGEFLSIAGPSGSGKTTLLNLLGCLDRPSSGEIYFEGRAVSGLDRTELARLRRLHIGFVFQTFNLIPVLTAFENVAFALSLLGVQGGELKRRTLAMLEEVGLAGLERRLPGELSGGQQQRVAVARALVKNPPLVLADEPTANLDSDTGAGILKLMTELNSRYGTTFVFSTHDPMVMGFARRLVHLHDGRVSKDERR